MPLLPLAGQPCSHQVSSNYANVAKYIQYIFEVQYITYHWQIFLGIFQLCKCGQSYTYLKCNTLHIIGTPNYANGAEGILDNDDPQCWWGR